MRLASIILASLVLLPACGHAADLPAPVATLMQPYTGDVPGASLLILKNGKPLVRRGFGLADLEQHVAVTPATNYRLASITKQFTAASVLLLAEDGKLALDDSIRHWLPSLPAAADKVTLRKLLDHTGGLLDYEDLIPPAQTAQVSDAQVLRLMAATDRTYFPPGSAYRYSNTGYVLLGLVVEKASDMTFPAFLKARIFGPLKMDHTLLYEHNRGPSVTHRAYGYSDKGGHWVRTDQSITSATRGDGAIYSSIDDLARWDAALYDDRLLSDASRRLAFTAHVKVTGEPYQAGYGFGWRVTGDTLWHSGETMGFRNVIVRWPKQHLTVIMLTNRNDPEPYRTALALAQPYLTP